MRYIDYIEYKSISIFKNMYTSMYKQRHELLFILPNSYNKFYYLTTRNDELQFIYSLL